jgi:cyclopropane fatty-acyl-phospholipid synthase-like methyltransferase
MSDLENDVARHYTHGALGKTVQGGLAALSKDTDANQIDLLAAVDEFHMGGRPATRTLAEALHLDATSTVLDIGCGMGGTARYLAATFGCKVTGIDLTPEYVSVGSELNANLGLSDQVNLSVASATDLPNEDNTFDRACMLHVGMNIADKKAVMMEAARVVRPGGYFGVYDVMLTGNDDIVFPVAWADTSATSFVAPISDYTDALGAAGFDVVSVEDKHDVAITFFEGIKARLAQGGPPPLGLHIVMGADAKLKVGNMYANVKNGTVSPVQIIAKRR